MTGKEKWETCRGVQVHSRVLECDDKWKSECELLVILYIHECCFCQKRLECTCSLIKPFISYKLKLVGIIMLAYTCWLSRTNRVRATEKKKVYCMSVYKAGLGVEFLLIRISGWRYCMLCDLWYWAKLTKVRRGGEGRMTRRRITKSPCAPDPVLSCWVRLSGCHLSIPCSRERGRALRETPCSRWQSYALQRWEIAH